MTKQNFISINKTLFFATALSVSAFTPIYSVHANTDTEAAQVKKSYLGVVIDHIPEYLQQHLGSILPQNQGILVRQVIDNSPADKAQLQAGDILLAYNEQKLFSTKQLTQLVRSAQAGEQATLHIVRNGQPQTIQVTIEAQQVPEHKTQHDSQHHNLQRHGSQKHGYGHHRPMMQHKMPFNGMSMPSWSSDNLGKNWDSFQSLSLQKLSDNQYKASIEFLDKDGQNKSFQFQGSRADIQEQLQQQEQLPKREKQQLMDLLSANSNLDFPDIGNLMSKNFFSKAPFDWKPMF